NQQYKILFRCERGGLLGARMRVVVTPTFDPPRRMTMHTSDTRDMENSHISFSFSRPVDTATVKLTVPPDQWETLAPPQPPANGSVSKPPHKIRYSFEIALNHIREIRYQRCLEQHVVFSGVAMKPGIDTKVTATKTPASRPTQ